MNEESLFAAALEIATAAERQAFLAAGCAGDAALRARVERLLAADCHTRGILERGPDGLAAGPGWPEPLAAGRTFAGRFVLRRKLGEGGMGEVWVADQTAPVRRRVALKVVRPGHDSARLLARFEQERQALALMDHPNIAKILDAGVGGPESDTGGPAGRPYFVMEYIDGVPVTAYCDANALTPRQRLGLFLPVCRAVQHAHQKGVIHRDIKPSNILVADVDGRPVPKVIDFGIAKATGPRLTEQSIDTEAGSFIGTLEYMSPEQADLTNPDTDTRSDVYGLGVVLYELLTGSVPFPRKDLTTLPLSEVLRMIREVDPPRPSLAAVRHAGPDKRTAALRGDLDWVVMKCLEKDRGRRYGTANELAADLERFLADEPVLAGPPSLAYRLRKFARRHRGPVLAAAAVAVVLVGGIVGTTLGLVHARRERDAAALARDDAVKAGQKALAAAAAEQTAKEAAEASDAEARAVLDFVEGRILAAMRPVNNGGLGQQATLRRAIEQALPFVETSFKKQPLTEARLRMTVGQSFFLQGRPETFKAAAEQFEAARRLYVTHRGADHPDTARCMTNLAHAYYSLDRGAEAAKLYEDSLAVVRAKLGPDHPTAVWTMDRLAETYRSLGRHAEALRLEEQVLTVQSAKLGRDHPDTLARMNILASRYTFARQHEDALKLRLELVSRHKAKDGRDHKNTLDSVFNLASTYASLGRHAEGLLVLEERRALERGKAGSDAPDRPASRAAPNANYVTPIRQAGALTIRDDLFALCQARDGPDHPSALLLAALGNLARCCSHLDRHPEAIQLGEELIVLHRAKFGPEAPATLRAASQLAVAYSRAGRDAEAVKTAEEVLAIRTAKLGPRHRDTLATKDDLASIHAAARRYSVALKLAEEVLAARRSTFGPDHPDTLDSMDAVVIILMNLRRGAEAVPLIDEYVKHAAGKDVNSKSISALMNYRLRHFETTKDAAGCRATAEMWERLNRTDADSLYTAARMRAVTAAVIRAADPKSAPPVEDAAEADRAMAWLKRAIAADLDWITNPKSGWALVAIRNWMARLKNDRAFAVLRDRDDFSKLVADLEDKLKAREAALPAPTAK